ncbi:serine/threonine kinase [Aureococcus anophagefferens]|nr:serine/threonine kinase [Aureococcus anophagefferens]
MDLKKNFWRASIDATSIYECIFEESCKGGANSSCARGHKGPLCGACKAHYFYDTAANRCVDCGNKIKASGDNIIGTVLAVLFVVAAIGVVMRNSRSSRRANDPTLESVRFLYEEFKPSCFMFMVYEVSCRIFAGCLSMFVPDSISQIAAGLLGSLISYRVFSHYEPYVEEDDGVVSEVAQTELVLVFFYALMVFATDNLEQHDGVFSGKVFASLVVLLASTLLIALWLIILANFSGDELRSCVAGPQRRRPAADDASGDGGAATVDAEAAVERADVALASARI